MDSGQEQARVRAHFRDVVAELRLRPSTHQRRAALIDELARYGERGEFPANRDYVGRRMPYFVDARGVRCAVAHLIHLTGDDTLVDDIARHHNNAYVPELANDARLHAWLVDAGFDAAEAARIQPEYCFSTVGCICAVLAQTEGSIVAIEGADDEQSVVREVLRAESDVAVGDRLTLQHPLAVGQRVLVSHYDFDTTPVVTNPFAVVTDDAVGFVQCDLKPVPMSDVRTLVHSDRSECRDVVLASHPEYDELVGTSCDPATDEPAEGCAGGAPSWLGVSAAVWALRRPRRWFGH